MSKNNNENKQSLVPTKGTVVIVILTLVVFGLGYYLAKSAPKTNQVATGDGMHGSPGAPNTAQLDSLVGKPLPSIQLVDKDGKSYKTDDFKGKFTILFFNEGLMCYPACWNQIAAFGNDQRFNTGNIQAVSVVTDSANDWKRAVSKMPQLAKANTMFDTGANASRQLGMLTTNSSMHRGSLPGHTYVVIDTEGVVRYVFDDPNMAIANDVIFKKIQSLTKI